MTIHPMIDIKTIKTDEILVLLAEWPCPNTYCSGPLSSGYFRGCAYCLDTHLAFRWVTEPCSAGQGCLACVPEPQGETYETLIYTRGRICNGSGRVPRVVRQEDVQAAIRDKAFDYNLSSRLFSIVRGKEPGDVIAFCGIGDRNVESPMLVWADTSLDAMLKAFLQVVISDVKS